jgi:hypothetical protein
MKITQARDIELEILWKIKKIKAVRKFICY